LLQLCILYATHNEQGPSIKDHEHAERGDSLTAYKITVPSQRRPVDFNRALLSSKFKTELLNFLIQEWTCPEYASLLEGHTVYYAVGQCCFIYTAEHGQVQRHQVHELERGHEEADTRLLFHAQYLSQLDSEAPKVIVVRSNDTDVFVLLIHHATQINAKPWMDAGAGVSSKNTRRYININAIAQKLTPSICLALPSFHAFTGCDYTSSFFRKAKSRPFDLLMKDRRFASAFGKLGSSRSVGAEVGAIIEEYVCAMYGVRNVTDVNEARYHLFRQLYAPTKPDQPLEKIKSSDPCCLPNAKQSLNKSLDEPIMLHAFGEMQGLHSL